MASFLEVRSLRKFITIKDVIIMRFGVSIIILIVMLSMVCRTLLRRN